MQSALDSIKRVLQRRLRPWTALERLEKPYKTVPGPYKALKRMIRPYGPLADEAIENTSKMPFEGLSKAFNTPG